MISHCPMWGRPLAVHRSWSFCKLAPQVAPDGLILYNGARCRRVSPCSRRT